MVFVGVYVVSVGVSVLRERSSPAGGGGIPQEGREYMVGRSIGFLTPSQPFRLYY